MHIFPWAFWILCQHAPQALPVLPLAGGERLPSGELPAAGTPCWRRSSAPGLARWGISPTETPSTRLSAASPTARLEPLSPPDDGGYRGAGPGHRGIISSRTPTEPPRPPTETRSFTAWSGWRRRTAPSRHSSWVFEAPVFGDLLSISLGDGIHQILQIALRIILDSAGAHLPALPSLLTSRWQTK